MKLWRRQFIARAVSALAALAASKRGLGDSVSAAGARMSAGDQTQYTMEVLSLAHAAREIHAGRGAQLAASIAQAVPDHLAPMLGFDETSFTIAAFYLAGLVIKTSNQAVPATLVPALNRGAAKVNQVLSNDCFEEIRCKAQGCVPWPTSLRAADVNAPNPMGWHYIVGSHCGFSWPKFWNLDCGPPIALKPCTGDEISAMQAAFAVSETAPARTAPLRKPNANDQKTYALQVLSLLHVAREIKTGRAVKLAASVAASLPDYLTPMLGFAETNLKTATFYLAGVVLQSSNQAVPSNLAPALARGAAKIDQVLSKDCFDEMRCSEPGCVPWPTSLRAANVNAPNPMGWHYIVGSHCGFSWPKVWNLDCGQPIALKPCTGDQISATQVLNAEQEAFVPHTSDPNGYITGTVVDPGTTGPTGFVYATVDAQGTRTSHNGTTDDAKRFAIFVPAGAALIQVAKRLDERGNLYKPVDCKVGPNLPVSGLRELPKAPPAGPAIVGGNSAWERSKPIEFQTRGVDPRNLQLQVDGKPGGQQILAASNSNVIARVQTTPGPHSTTLVSGGTPTNACVSDFIDATIALTGSSQLGGTKAATLQVVGLPPDHPATCTFTISGASQFIGKTNEVTVPVVNGRATAPVRNVRPGETVLRWQLHVKIPGVWD